MYAHIYVILESIPKHLFWIELNWRCRISNIGIPIVKVGRSKDGLGVKQNILKWASDHQACRLFVTADVAGRSFDSH